LTRFRNSRVSVAWMVIFLIAMASLAFGWGCGSIAAGGVGTVRATVLTTARHGGCGTAGPLAPSGGHCGMSGPCCPSDSGASGEPTGREGHGDVPAPGPSTGCLTAADALLIAVTAEPAATTLDLAAFPLLLPTWQPPVPALRIFAPLTRTESQDPVARPLNPRSPPAFLL